MCRRAFTLVELLVVVIIIAVLISILLPALSHLRKAAIQSRMSSYPRQENAVVEGIIADPKAGTKTPVSRVMARVTSFSADVVLTPRLSVGTAEPESIYEAKFTSRLQAVKPTGENRECEIELPLPPEIISLADLSVSVNGEPSDRAMLRDRKLVWSGTLNKNPTPLVFTYTAVGKGLYELSVPPGGILDSFVISLTANGSDVRMLELSLQPTKLFRADGSTVYTWDYKRLMTAQPIRLDVLGIAPIDRLGELSWLGPLSLVAFGLLVGLFAHAWRIRDFDRWMLLLTLGTFAGAYPLMYFAQEIVNLRTAIVGSAATVILIIAIRAITIMGVRLSLLGVIFPAITIMTITLVAAIQPSLQGMLLTIEALGFFIAAMMLLPNLRMRTPMQHATPVVA